MVEVQKVRSGHEKVAEDKYPYPPEPQLDADLETGQKDIWQVKEEREEWMHKKDEIDERRTKYVEAAMDKHDWSELNRRTGIVRACPVIG